VAAEFADSGIADFVAGASLGVLDVAAMRAGVSARASARTPGPELPDVFDVQAGSRPARVYRPDTAADGPVLVWLHGGGWTIGGIPFFDRVCRRLARAAAVSVVSLDYRLAPEHPWPAGVDDAAGAIVWLGTEPAELRFRPTALAVGGDSAGGTLAALATLRLVREMPQAKPDVLAMCYANTDLAADFPSRREKAHGFGLDIEVVEFFSRQWVVDRRRWTAPGVSPLRSEYLGELPPTLLVTAEHDLLRDEGKAFADRLSGENVDVRYRCEPGLIHNFLMLDEISATAATAGDRFAAEVGDLLRSRSGASS
jgi:acetyl esterase